MVEVEEASCRPIYLRLLYSLWLGMAVSTLMVSQAWWMSGEADWYAGQRRIAEDLGRLDQEVAAYYESRGKYPHDLIVLYWANPLDMREFDRPSYSYYGTAHSGRNRRVELHYAVTDSGYELIWYGNDCSPGGVGANGDIAVGRLRGNRIPLFRDFIWHTQSRLMYALGFGILSFFMGLRWFRYLQRGRAGGVRLAVKLGLLLLVAFCFGEWLAGVVTFTE